MKKLRDIGYLVYTGKIAPNSKNIPIYRIKLNHGLSGGDKCLTTDSQSFKDGLSGNLTTDSEGIWIDYRSIDNKKDNKNLFSNSLKVDLKEQEKAHNKRLVEYKEIIKKRKKLSC